MLKPLEKKMAPSWALRCRITGWAAWAPGQNDNNVWGAWDAEKLPLDDGAVPDIRFVDPMLRRRLGRLSRMALHVANEAAGETDFVPAVFASRHGELSRTVHLLHDLARMEAPSPAAFSLSVHNTAAGIFSIAKSDTALSTALAAGEETFLWALQDAVLRLEASPASRVLLVYADEPLPNEYQSGGSSPGSAFALALLITAGSDLELTWDENIASVRSQRPLPLAFFSWLLGQNESLLWHGDRLSVQGRHHA